MGSVVIRRTLSWKKRLELNIFCDLALPVFSNAKTTWSSCMHRDLQQGFDSDKLFVCRLGKYYYNFFFVSFSNLKNSPRACFFLGGGTDPSCTRVVALLSYQPGRWAHTPRMTRTTKGAESQITWQFDIIESNTIFSLIGGVFLLDYKTEMRISRSAQGLYRRKKFYDSEYNHY